MFLHAVKIEVFFSETLYTSQTHIGKKLNAAFFHLNCSATFHRRFDLSLSSALLCKQANKNIASASSAQGRTTTQLCSMETQTIFSDFCHSQAGFAAELLSASV